MLSTLQLKWHAFVSRRMLNDGFTLRALQFWPSRKIAQHQASQLFDVVSGFVYSQILYSAVKLDLFEMLREPTTPALVSNKTGLDEQAAERLLRATSALRLTKSLPNNHYGLGTLGIAMLTNPGLSNLVEHHDLLYRDLADPLAVLTSSERTSLGAYWSYSKSTNPSEIDTSGSEEVRAYSALMSASQPMVTEQILQSYSFDEHTKLLDLGGGTGQFLSAVRKRYPDLELELFDLPAVKHISDSTLLRKLNIVSHSGDFFNHPLPKSADVISLVRILHDHNDDAVEKLLSKIYATLPDGGTVVVAEPLADTRGATRVGDAYFNYYFLAMGKGEPRNKKRLTQLLTNAGFIDVCSHSTQLPLVCSVISGRVKKKS